MTDLEELAREKIRKNSKRDDNGCLVWTAGLKSGGYGALRVGDKVHAAHRLNYQLEVGPIPDGLHIDHLCRNPPCIEPTHLEPVTPLENFRRGDGLAIFKKLRACVNGHEWTTATTRMTWRPAVSRWTRLCLTCANARGRYL